MNEVIKKTVRSLFTKIWDKNNIHNLYLAIALLFGFLFVFLVPPMFGFDEPAHFYRAYQLSEGDLFADKKDGRVGYELPSNMVKNLDKFRLKNMKVSDDFGDKSSSLDTESLKDLREKPSNLSKTMPDFRGATIYAPTSYLFATTGILLAKFLNTSIYLYVIFARLATLIGVVTLFYLAIRCIPKGKVVLFFIALLPASLIQYSTVSADSVLLGAVALFVAYSTKLLFNASRGVGIESLSKIDLSLLALSVILIGLAKPGYGFLVLPLLILPFILWRIKKTRKSIMPTLISVLALVLTPFLLTVTWQIVQSKAVGGYTGVTMSNIGYVNPKEQVKYIISSPKEYTITLGDHYLGVRQNYPMTSEMFSTLTAIPLQMPYHTLIIFYITLAILVLTQKSIGILLSKEKIYLYILLTASVCLTVLIITTALYVTFTPVRNDYIIGVQSRYFIPLLLLLILVPWWRRPPLVLNESKRFKLAFFVANFFLIVALLRIVDTIYIR